MPCCGGLSWKLNEDVTNLWGESFICLLRENKMKGENKKGASQLRRLLESEWGSWLPDRSLGPHGKGRVPLTRSGLVKHPF